VTVAELRGEDRFVTSHLAETMARPRLQDQTRPIGLLYGSKLGSDWDCWTVWLRDGVHNAIIVDAGEPVLHPDENPVLLEVLKEHGLLIPGMWCEQARHADACSADARKMLVHR
jgi:hypothetical protein